MAKISLLFPPRTWAAVCKLEQPEAALTCTDTTMHQLPMGRTYA